MTKVISPTNIAVVKYWGKQPGWEKEHIPTKSSLSFTVDGLYTKTEIDAKRINNEKSGIKYVKIDVEINGRRYEEKDKEFKKVQEFIDNAGRIFPEILGYNYTIKTENNFPTSAGFASSASGFSALATGINNEIGLNLNEMELSVLARLGSGSAARSIPINGGLVVWHRGDVTKRREEILGKGEYMHVVKSSYSESIIPYNELEELSIMYVVVSDKKKEIGSREGMERTVKTCPIYWDWVRYEEKTLLHKVIEQIKTKDWHNAFKSIIHASNGMHATMLYTIPPIIYINDMTVYIIKEILEMWKEGIECAYTIDAGPNPVIITLKNNIKKVYDRIKSIVGEHRIFVTSVGKGARVIKE